MAHGGKREGAGRPKGIRSKRTLGAMHAGTNGLSPLDYMLEVLRDEGADRVTRMDAAKAAAPYVHSRLSNVEMAVTDDTRTETELTERELSHIATTGSAGVIEPQASPQESAEIH